MKHFLLLISIIFIAPFYSFCQPSPNVKIGTQIWQSKNLDVTVFSNGDRIFEAKSIKDWNDAFSSKQPAWCYYNFNAENGKKYGKLYNMYAVMDSRGLAPIGYHIPSENEWDILEKFIGSENAGKKLKSTYGWSSSKRWMPGKVKCTNCAPWSADFHKKFGCLVCFGHKTVNSDFAKQVIFSGNGSDIFHFQALPSGQLRTNEFHELGKIGVWWSVSDPNKKIGSFKVSSDFEFLYNNDYWTSSYPQTYSTYYGNSVRCIKDDLKSASNKMQTFSKGTVGSEQNSNINNNIPAINPNRANSSQINVSISGWPTCVQNSRQKIIFIITDKNDIPVTYFKELAGADDYLAKNENKGYEVKKEACIFYFEDCDLDPQGPFSCEMYLRKNGTFISSGDYKVGKWKCSERDRVQYYDIRLE
jgi:uncharacterized protein (TIGR02145 family)